MKAESESGDPPVGSFAEASFGQCVGPGPRTGTLQAWAPGQVLQRRRSGQAALASEHYGKAPSLLADSVEKTPPLSHPLLSLFLPQQPGGAFPLPHTPSSRPWGSQAGPRQEFPLRALTCYPTPRHPQNLGFNVYFLIRMPASRGASGRPQCEQGALEGGYLFSPALTFTQGEIHLPGKAGPQSRHYGCLTECVWHFFFNLLISFTCAPPQPIEPDSPCQQALTPGKSRAYLFSE